MHSILEYCLENLPKSYESTYPIQNLTQGQSGSLEVTIKSTQYNRNILFIESFSSYFDRFLRIIIFNAKPYHAQIFKPNKTLIVLGSIEIQYDRIANRQIPILVNPKVTTHTNTILPLFKKRGLKLNSLYNKITLQSLQESKIPDNHIQCLYEIFYPTPQFFQTFNQLKTFPKQHLEAIKFCEILLYITRLRKKKTHFTSKFQCHGSTTPLLENLPFTLTHAQLQAIAEIQSDLASNRACRRIIMGDVGCGKTMVILASVMLTYPYKSILMAPTTILAQQLYVEAKKYLPSYIHISCIISTTSKKESSLPLQGDFIIGTQALLFREADFKDFALVMTDEQHRFGTNTRLQLEKMLETKNDKEIKKPHNLQFSATPIPRTMAMIQSNVIDFSFIKDLPFKKDIDTIIINKSRFSSLISRIKDEIAKGHQIAIIYPLIEKQDEKEDDVNSNLFESDAAQSYRTTIKDEITKQTYKIPYMSLKDGEKYWQKNFENVFSTHGKDREKELILEQFAKTKGAILLATTMIEVGISLPQLSVIVIVGAERLGLASLHQLRGRVSRNGLKGYCYLYTHHIGNERLNRFANTLSGFDIAELDLEYRNSGDLLDGKIQSGNQFDFFDMSHDSSILQEAQQYLESQL